MSQLMKLAAAAGVSPDEIAESHDEEDPREVLAQLIERRAGPRLSPVQAAAPAEAAVAAAPSGGQKTKRKNKKRRKMKAELELEPGPQLEPEPESPPKPRWTAFHRPLP